MVTCWKRTVVTATASEDIPDARALRGIARARKTASQLAELFGDSTLAVLHELRKQGVNLNQIAHHCNQHQVPPPPEVSQLAGVILALWQRLMP